MAFVVEDGTGLPNANSYVSVADADDYFEFSDAWTGLDADKERWLVAATRYIDTAFGSRLQCYTPLEENQALLFPTNETGLPKNLITACCEYALRAMQGPLMPDPNIDASGFAVVTTKRKVGPIERNFYVAGAQNQPLLYRQYPYPDMLMGTLLCGYSGGTRVIR